ncbi:MAG: EFR1 family ferrodoxin [Victivallaceae bacterium]|nr:EFR1 family ferrodoxin [Victivallaceae bacterium]
MKTILYYFSGTGNTLMLARLLAKKLDNTEIINIVSCTGAGPAQEADAIGILFPVYAFGLPKIMYNFVKNNLQVTDDTYIFSLVNYGSTGGPAALHLLRTLLEDKGSKLNAGFGLTMPSSYIPFGGAGSHEKQNKRFLAAAEKINQIAKIIKERPENYFYKKSRIPLFIARIFNNFFMTKFKKDVKKHYVTDNCIFCKTCSKICPNQNIQMIEEQPSWGDNCEQCMACLQWCPAVAIHRRDVPKARHRYQNPGIEAIDLIKDIQGQAE